MSSIKNNNSTSKKQPNSSSMENSYEDGVRDEQRKEMSTMIHDVFMKQPISSAMKETFDCYVEDLKEEQLKELNLRISSNLEYEKIAIPRILEEVKKMKGIYPISTAVTPFEGKLTSEGKSLESMRKFVLPAEPNFLVAVLIRSKNKTCPKTKKCLELLRFHNINQCVILKNNLCNRNLLKTCSSHIAYGYLNYSLLRTLIYSKGCAILRCLNGSKKRVKLTNEIIDSQFNGKYRCIEELIFGIYSGCSGNNDELREILRFFSPFNLACPYGGFTGKKRLNILEGGSSGNHMDLVGDLIEKMIH